MGDIINVIFYMIDHPFTSRIFLLNPNNFSGVLGVNKCGASKIKSAINPINDLQYLRHTSAIFRIFGGNRDDVWEARGRIFYQLEMTSRVPFAVWSM